MGEGLPHTSIMHPHGTEFVWIEQAAQPIEWELGQLRLMVPIQFSKSEYVSRNREIVEDWIHKLPGLKDGGSINLALIFKEASLNLLLTLFDRKPYHNPDDFEVRLPKLTGQNTGMKIQYKGYLGKIESSEFVIQNNDPTVLNCSLMVVRKPIIVPAT